MSSSNRFPLKSTGENEKNILNQMEGLKGNQNEHHHFEGSNLRQTQPLEGSCVPFVAVLRLTLLAIVGH